MYASIDDPYCYPGTDVLINRLGITDGARLEAFEEEVTRERAAEPLPNGRLGVAHYFAVHRHLFRDVYRWAGRPRTVRISRGHSAFAYPEQIASCLERLFGRLKADAFLRGRPPDLFARGAASFLAELNHIHAFRDGNGRAQLAFMSLLAAQAGHPLDLSALHPSRFLAAMIASFHGHEDELADQILHLIDRRE